MRVIYRITEIPSTNPSPWGKDKLELNKVCLRSFVRAFHEVNPEMYFLADYCSGETDKMISKIVPFPYEIEHTEVGINATMVKSYEIAEKLNDYVLFQECDYLYRPLIGAGYLNALKVLKLISPYDHLNFYLDNNIHSSQCHIELVGGQHFRTTERNTMTWATHSSVVRDNSAMLKRHGYLDDKVWEDFMVAGCVLWVPILSWSTHCVKDYLAPGVRWNEIWNINQS